MNNKIIIFGATGSVGAYCALDLKSQGFDVVAVGKRETDNGFFADYAINYVSLDITEKSSFSKLPQKDIYAVVHLAGALPAKMKNYQPQLYIDTVITGTLNVLDYIVASGAKKIIFSQSVSDVIHLYGSKKPIDADVQRKFPQNDDHSIYGICKNAAVDIIEHYHYKYGIQHYILRFPNIYLYMPNPMYYKNAKLVWQGYRLLIEKAKKSEQITIYGNPNVVRDIVYVKDCVQIIKCAIEDKSHFGIYNVGTGIGTSIDKQIKGIIEVFSPSEKPSAISYDTSKPDTPEYIMDISKTKNELGYEPKYDYISYLKDMKEEMEKNRFKKLFE